MKANIAADKFSDGNEKHIIGNQRKDNPYYKVAKNLAVCPVVGEGARDKKSSQRWWHMRKPSLS